MEPKGDLAQSSKVSLWRSCHPCPRTEHECDEASPILLWTSRCDGGLWDRGPCPRYYIPSRNLLDCQRGFQFDFQGDSRELHWIARLDRWGKKDEIHTPFLRANGNIQEKRLFFGGNNARHIHTSNSSFTIIVFFAHEGQREGQLFFLHQQAGPKGKLKCGAEMRLV